MQGTQRVPAVSKIAGSGRPDHSARAPSSGTIEGMPALRTLEEIWPPYALTIRCGDLTLSPVREADLPELLRAAKGGVQPEGLRVFPLNWDEGDMRTVAGNLATYHWGVRAATKPDNWAFEFTARLRGEVIGVQSIRAEHYPVLHAAETGSWMSREFQGRGLGTLMRQTIAAAFFDSFDAKELYTTYVDGNAPSRRVSEKTGYVENGRVRSTNADGEATVSHRMVLRPEALVRPAEPVVVIGAEPFRDFLGLDEES